jgi:hypothetical protein
MNVSWPNESTPEVQEYDPVEEAEMLLQADREMAAKRAAKRVEKSKVPSIDSSTLDAVSLP